MLMSTRTRRMLGTRHKGLRLFGDDGGLNLLNDQYTTDLAAGAVNGTSAVPGPGLRTVVDTNNVLSIVGSVLNFATGGVGAGNPGLWYGGLTRVFGRLAMATLTAISGTTMQFGLDANQSAAITDAIRLSGTSLLATGIVVGAITVGPAYSLCLVMRNPTGAYFLIKGGTFTNWTLVWIGGAGTSTAFPAIGVSSGTIGVFTADNVIAPIGLYTLTPLAYDTFTRADGALGNSEIVGPDGQVVTARAWTVQDGTIAIVSNAASLTVVGGALNAIATLNGVSADVMVDAAVTRTLGSGGITLRYVDANNYLRATHDGTNALLEQVVAGVPTTLRTGVATYAAGAVLRVILSGTTGLLFYNNAAVGAVFTVPASVATLHGLYGSDLSCLWDNFTVLARGVGNEYSGLDLI